MSWQEFVVAWCSPRFGFVSYSGLAGLALAGGAVVRAVATGGEFGPGVSLSVACALAVLALDYRRNR